MLNSFNKLVGRGEEWSLMGHVPKQVAFKFSDVSKVFPDNF